ncbi:hypothetical protein H9649_05765 [Sporosarcina sp. Sa2YVA2]|uniref:DUF3139 domain-containing protein n=1 Tax=Sporosarcina quadrami TaxID=2762234 RepID=A0ABR8U8L2_9BACL|nr:hypothetical protein [Sporosarcina quadrami]MBD7984079.1 hypothetical protein [Sporosarcina quadrami]
MKRKAFMFILSLIAVFSVTVGVQGQFVSASEVETVNELQQKSKQVTETIDLEYVPPVHYFYSSGGYAGYLRLVSYIYHAKDEIYRAIYTGTLYDGPPYPAPFSINIEDEY